jgi:hypothetical protein
MAKAETSPTAISWPPEGLPVDAACKSIMAPPWDNYAKARKTAGKNLDRVKRMVLSLSADDEGRLKAREEARRELTDELVHRLAEGELELWGRPGSPWVEPQRIPASALQLLCLDYEERAGSGGGWELYDLRLRQAKPNSNSTADRIYTVAQRLKAAGKIPANIRPTHLAKLLANEDAKDAKLNNSIKPVGSGHIKNHLKEWGLWPVSRIK